MYLNFCYSRGKINSRENSERLFFNIRNVFQILMTCITKSIRT